jgi:hypothetical protein
MLKQNMMKYKIADTELKLKEYGRNVQSMVEYAKTVEDRDKRNRLAHEIVQIMSNLNPNVKELPDYKLKLWDHLFVISNFELDVDSPFPIPEPEKVLGRPKERMAYYEGRPHYRQYGWNVELMIRAAVEMEHGPERDEYINQIANTMKLFLVSMNRDSIPESVIADQMNELSGGKLKVKGDDLTIKQNFKQLFPPPKPVSTNNKRGRSKGRSKRKN